MISLVDTEKKQHLNEIQTVLQDKERLTLATVSLQTLLTQERRVYSAAQSEGTLLEKAFTANVVISGISALQRILATRGADAYIQAQELYDVMRKYQRHLPPEAASLFIASLAQQTETQTS